MLKAFPLVRLIDTTMTSSTLISATLVVVVSVLLIVTGLKKQPGIGILGTLLLVALTLWLRGESLTIWGFGPPESWGSTLLLGLVLGILIQLLSIAVIEPLSEKLTHSVHDHSVVEGVRGNWKVFFQLMLLVWLFVAVLEEGLYRGFLMTEIARIIGTGATALIVNVLISSLVFGLSHAYQGRSGIMSTSVAGLFLGGIFVLSGFNLWLAIFTHGFIDTVGIGLIAVNGDTYIRRKLWGARGSTPQ
jgi:uncharacterized protein